MNHVDSPSALSEHAARWAVRVDAGTLTRTEEAELDAWTRADPRHAGAFARAMAATTYLDRVLDPRTEPDSAPTGDRRPSLDAITAGSRWATRRTWMGGGLAAAAAAIAAIGLSVWRSDERIVTPLGAVRRSALADGSAITLNSNADVRVALGEKVRHVRLVTGEVDFEVAKDASRPFIVQAGDVSIRVVGTSFLVRRFTDRAVAVTVREGIVEVRHGGAAPTRLLAGDRLVIDGAAVERQRLSMVDIDRLSLWQRGDIDLTGMTLEAAAREFGRYSDQNIVVPDPQVARLKVAGIYSTSDPIGFARAAALAQGLKLEVRPGGVILFR